MKNLLVVAVLLVSLFSSCSEEDVITDPIVPETNVVEYNKPLEKKLIDCSSKELADAGYSLITDLNQNAKTYTKILNVLGTGAFYYTTGIPKDGSISIYYEKKDGSWELISKVIVTIDNACIYSSETKRFKIVSQIPAGQNSSFKIIKFYPADNHPFN
jgi:hypothetical protein